MSDLKNAIAQVKLAYDIADYISSSGVTLRPAGVNKQKGLCCFHNERTPSFTVDTHFQNYRCFGCGANGDIIKFVQAYEHLEFFDALKKLAEDKGIDLNLDGEKSSIDYTSLRKAMRSVANFFYAEFKKLDDDHPAKQEVANRGLDSRKFLYGYAPNGRQTLYRHLKSEGFNDEVILQTGACSQYTKDDGSKTSISDFWRGRLMFYITDVTGKPIGWSGRKLYEDDQRGKYVNSRDGILFDKSASLFNIDKAKEKAVADKTIYVNEGQFDVAAMSAAGLTNAVASSGTAFTEKQGLMLRRLVGEDGRLIFCFDGDSAGRAAAQKVFETVPIIHGQAYVVSLPDGYDPCDYRLENGDEALVQYINDNTVPLVEFILDQVAVGYDLHSEIEKSQYVSAAARVLATLSSNVLKEAYSRHVSLISFTSLDVVKGAAAKAEPITKSRPVAEEDDKELSRPVIESKEEDEVEVSFEELVDKIADSERYKVSAQLMKLCLSSVVLVNQIDDEVFRLIPKEFRSMIDDMRGFSEDTRIIPEVFANFQLAEYLMLMQSLPFEHLMSDDHKEKLFDHFSKELKRMYSERLERQIKNKVAGVLRKSSQQGPEFLEKAIESEQILRESYLNKNQQM